MAVIFKVMINCRCNLGETSYTYLILGNIYAKQRRWQAILKLANEKWAKI
jgi:hypothetical protein